MRRFKIKFYRSKDGWRWTISTLNDITLGASTEGYTQRIGCTKNFRLVTGFKPPVLPGRAKLYVHQLEVSSRMLMRPTPFYRQLS
jgi:uncharacterized protein YegP (UPF0339 family)